MSKFIKLNVNQAIHKGTSDIIKVAKWDVLDVASINNRIKMDSDVDDDTKAYIDMAWKLMNIVMSLANEIASGAIKDLEWVLIRNDMYKFDIKRRFRQAYNAIYKNTKYAREHIWKGEEFLLDYCDYAQEQMQDDINKLKSSIEIALREHNNEVNAQACFAVCLVDIACMAYDMIHKVIKQETHYDFYEAFDNYYPSEAEIRMVDLAKALTNDDLFGTVSNSMVKTGTTIVLNRITDYDALIEYARDITENENK